MGIGREVDEHTLQLIAGEGNPVVMVDTFDQLQDEIETIKSSACSGKSALRGPKTFAFRVYTGNFCDNINVANIFDRVDYTAIICRQFKV